MMIYLTPIFSTYKIKGFKPQKVRKLALNLQLQTLQILKNHVQMLIFCLSYFIITVTVSCFRRAPLVLMQYASPNWNLKHKCNFSVRLDRSYSRDILAKKENLSECAFFAKSLASTCKTLDHAILYPLFAKKRPLKEVWDAILVCATKYGPPI